MFLGKITTYIRCNLTTSKELRRYRNLIWAFDYYEMNASQVSEGVYVWCDYLGEDLVGSECDNILDAIENLVSKIEAHERWYQNNVL